MAVLTTSNTSRTTPIDLPTTAVAASGGGDKIANTTGEELLYIENTGGGSVTLTVTIPATLDGQTVTNRTYTIANNERKVIGPWPTGVYNDSNAQVSLSYSGVTGVKVAVFKKGG